LVVFPKLESARNKSGWAWVPPVNSLLTSWIETYRVKKERIGSVLILSTLAFIVATLAVVGVFGLKFFAEAESEAAKRFP